MLHYEAISTCAMAFILGLLVVLQQAFLFKFGDVNKAVSVSFELEFWIFTLNIKNAAVWTCFIRVLLVFWLPALLCDGGRS